MKVLLSRFAQVYGGAERSFVTNARALSQNGVDVYAVSQLPEIIDGLKQHKIRATRLHFLSARLMHMKALFILLSIPMFCLQNLWVFVRFRPDLVYAHSRIDHVFWSLTKALHKRPVFWKDPSDLAWTFEVEPTSFYGKLHIKALQNCDALYVLSDKYLSRLTSALPAGVSLPEKTIVAPSGIIPDDYKIKPHELNPIHIVSVGRLHEAKGFDALLKAAKLLDKYDFKLIIAGDGEEHNKLIRLRNKLGLQKKVVFAGAVDSPADLLNSSSIFVSAAEVEPWGLAISEARLFGKAIVCTPTEGALKQIADGKTGLICKNFSSESIANTINKLLADKSLRKRLGDGAQKHLSDIDFRLTLKTKIIPEMERLVGQK